MNRVGMCASNRKRWLVCIVASQFNFNMSNKKMHRSWWTHCNKQIYKWNLEAKFNLLFFKKKKKKIDFILQLFDNQQHIIRKKRNINTNSIKLTRLIYPRFKANSSFLKLYIYITYTNLKISLSGNITRNIVSNAKHHSTEPNFIVVINRVGCDQ